MMTQLSVNPLTIVMWQFYRDWSLLPPPMSTATTSMLTQVGTVQGWALYRPSVVKQRTVRKPTVMGLPFAQRLLHNLLSASQHFLSELYETQSVFTPIFILVLWSFTNEPIVFMFHVGQSKNWEQRQWKWWWCFAGSVDYAELSMVFRTCAVPICSKSSSNGMLLTCR